MRCGRGIAWKAVARHVENSVINIVLPRFYTGLYTHSVDNLLLIYNALQELYT